MTTVKTSEIRETHDIVCFSYFLVLLVAMDTVCTQTPPSYQLSGCQREQLKIKPHKRIASLSSSTPTKPLSANDKTPDNADSQWESSWQPLTEPLLSGDRVRSVLTVCLLNINLPPTGIQNLTKGLKSIPVGADSYWDELCGSERY